MPDSHKYIEKGIQETYSKNGSNRLILSVSVIF